MQRGNIVATVFRMVDDDDDDDDYSFIKVSKL